MTQRIALGCMRISEEALSLAVEMGFRLFDTARAYGESEAMLGRALAGISDAFVVTKCGMLVDGAQWTPDGRAREILSHAEASVAALGRVPDVLLLHAPDPKVPFATSVRALVKAKESGLAHAIGLSNVNRSQLEEAAAISPIAIVSVAMGAFEDRATRSGVLAYCAARGITLFAHAPFGGPKRASRVLGHEIMLSYLLAVSPCIVPVVGPRRKETLESVWRTFEMKLEEEDLGRLDARFPQMGAFRSPRKVERTDKEVVMLAGLPGAGKSTHVASYVASGHTRLNRDTMGGTLAKIARRLDDELGRGSRFVLDNTYLTRESRSEVVLVAKKHGARVTYVLCNTSPFDAQINIVSRMLDRTGALLGGADLKQASRKDPNLMAPTSFFRMEKSLEPPQEDEGFDAIERIPFQRRESGDRSGAGIALDLVVEWQGGWRPRAGARQIVSGIDAPLLVYGWLGMRTSEGLDAIVRASLGRDAHIAVCPHADGPPSCWCRPPLPGAWVHFAREHGIAASKSVMFGRSASDSRLAHVVGVRYEAR